MIKLNIFNFKTFIHQIHLRVKASKELKRFATHIMNTRFILRKLQNKTKGHKPMKKAS